ncbi:MAG: hypothetical protein C4527_28325 [Candidatus Omnitrophota bacterium]|jgi:hypothetical protein|nr:MAG: hypothetical protein C4527_28325 [Candidatus Omnitrophota bacterium]
MKNLPKSFIPFVLAPMVTVFFFMMILDAGELVEVPSSVYKWFFALLGMFLFWWPIDMLLHWEKRTPASIQKDKYIAMVSTTLILFVFPYWFFVTPFWPTLGAAVMIGIVIPTTFMTIRFLKSKVRITTPEKILHLGMESPRAKEFLNYFPDANQYVYGLTAGEGDRSHLILHKRQPTEAYAGAQIDFVLDIPVDHRINRFVGGKEQLKCYLFVNDKGNAGIGFLPSSNIGRALDYGFSDDELDKAISEATTLDHRWPALGDAPLDVQHYPGKVVKIGG